MTRSRRKVTAVRREFHIEIKRLERFDAENQARFSKSTGTGQLDKLSKNQLQFLTEAIFFKSYRAYETFVRDVFLLYSLERRPHSGAKVTSFLKPINFSHAEQLIQSSMPFLDWTNPDTLIERAEVYLKDGFPIKLPYSTNLESLRDFRRIRNHIAHDSKESLEAYKLVLRRHYGTVPLKIPSPGEFLLVSDKNNPRKYKLLVFFDLMKRLSIDLT